MRHRKEKVNQLIGEEVSKILQRELEVDNQALVTVTRAIVSKDLQQAKVYLSISPFHLAKEILPEIKRQIYHFQQILNQRLRMHPVPKISFILDSTEEKAAKIRPTA